MVNGDPVSGNPDPNAPTRGAATAVDDGAGAPADGDRNRPGPTHANSGDDPQQPSNERRPTFTWMPVDYNDMRDALNGVKYSRQVVPVPNEVALEVARMIREPDPDLEEQKKAVMAAGEQLKKTMGGDHADPKTNRKRIEWRVGVSIAAAALLLPFGLSVAILGGGVWGASWLYMHQVGFRKWRGLDDQRAEIAAKKRLPTLRAPFKDIGKSAKAQRAARIAAWVAMAAFSPVGFVAEGIAQLGRDAKIKEARAKYEDVRVIADERENEKKGRIQQLVYEARLADKLVVPAGVNPSPRQYDILHEMRTMGGATSGDTRDFTPRPETTGVNRPTSDDGTFGI